jgi:hypothetical protein
MSDAPQITGPSSDPPFRSRETRPPNLGLGIEEALAKLQRRRAEEAGGEPQQRQPAPLAADRPPVPLDRPLTADRPPPPAARAADRPPELPPPDAQMPYTEQLPRRSDDPQDDAAGLVVQVEVDGQLVPVTVDELRRGYLREHDYRRKSQQLTTDLRRAQEMQQQFAAARQALEQRLPAYAAPAEFAAPVDWEKLAREDPIGSVQKIARLLAAQQAQAEAQQLAQTRAQEEIQRKHAMMQAGHEVLCRVIPGWADPATRTLIQQAIAQHAVSLGYPAEQVSSAEVLDPREILMAWKSMNYDRLMQARVQPQPVGARTVNGNGSNRRQPQAAALSELEERFQQTHHIDDALAVMKARDEARRRPDMPQLGRLR